MHRKWACLFFSVFAIAAEGRAGEDLCFPAGAGLGEIGVVRQPEANPEGPRGLHAHGDRLYLLDALHRRIQVFGGGAISVIALERDSDEAFAVLPNGRLALLDLWVRRELTILEADGKILSRLPLSAKHIDEPGAVLAVRAVAYPGWEGIWLELATASGRRRALRMTDAEGSPVSPIGVPAGFSADGRLPVDFWLARDRLELTLYPQGRFAEGKTLAFRLPGLALIHGLWLDRNERIWLVGRFEKGRRQSERLLALSPRGETLKEVRLPSSKETIEIFAPLTVDAAGRLHWLYYDGRGRLCVRRIDVE
ncbi:MAG: hypothetical protein N2441_06595 [Rhodocyclaceae bacterium]|nr:hypothetical protein [Rhodocyclaceae bacterium]